MPSLAFAALVMAGGPLVYLVARRLGRQREREETGRSGGKEI
jgi:hypothetical protein